MNIYFYNILLLMSLFSCTSTAREEYSPIKVAPELVNTFRIRPIMDTTQSFVYSYALWADPICIEKGQLDYPEYITSIGANP